MKIFLEHLSDVTQISFKWSRWCV